MVAHPTAADTRRTLTLSPLGEVSLQLPRRFADRAMLMAAHAQEQGDHGRKGLVFAAAWGLCWNDPRYPLPRFNPATDRIAAYGAAVLDHLIGKYHVPIGDTLWTGGIVLVAWVVDSVPTEQEVSKTTNFISPRGEE